MKEFLKNMLRAFVPPPKAWEVTCTVLVVIGRGLVVAGYILGIFLGLAGLLSSIFMVCIGDIEVAKNYAIITVVSAFVYSYCYALMKHFKIDFT